MNGDDYDDTLNIARDTTNLRLFLAILFSFLAVVGSGSVASAHLLDAPRGAREVFTAQEDIGKIWSSGRVWGQTEGSVYGMTTPNASRLRSMIDTPIVDPGTIIFRGNAAQLFKPHEVVGPFSGIKRLLGQQKAGFGDVIFDDAYKVGNRIYVYEAHVGSHLGQSTNFAMSRLWTRRIVIDGTLDVGVGIGVGAAGVYLWNQE